MSRASREQLARIYESVRRGGKAASERNRLRKLLAENLYDPGRGTYIPTSPDVFLAGKLPTVSERLSWSDHGAVGPFGAALFTNALVIPSGYGAATFDPDKAPAPKLRLTNIGFLVVTLEYDATTSPEFEEVLSWTRGDIDTSAFAAVDRELSRLKDYRGYCIVLSGSRSVHFHCLFSTKHLTNIPYDAVAELRRSSFREDSAVLENAHRLYWDHVNSVFKSVLHPSLPADSQLRRATQWRRSPWGIRTLDKDSPILGLRKGTRIPQIVIRENIRSRAGSAAKEYLVAPNFSVATPLRSPADASRPDANIMVGDASRLIALLQEECRDEWGAEYPKPVEVSQQTGDWVIRFRNHPGDKKPSTIVIGDHRRLLIRGHSDFADQTFFLPDHMTANETIDHLAQRSGQVAVRQQPTEAAPPSTPAKSSWRDVPILDVYSGKTRRHFAEPLSDKPLQEIKQAYRDKLWHELFQNRDWSERIVVISGEGIGKTSTLLPLLFHEAQDDAYSHNRRGSIFLQSTTSASKQKRELFSMLK